MRKYQESDSGGPNDAVLQHVSTHFMRRDALLNADNKHYVNSFSTGRNV